MTLYSVSWSFSSTILSPYTLSASCSQRRTRSSGVLRVSAVENRTPCPRHRRVSVFSRVMRQAQCCVHVKPQSSHFPGSEPFSCSDDVHSGPRKPPIAKSMQILEAGGCVCGRRDVGKLSSQGKVKALSFSGVDGAEGTREACRRGTRLSTATEQWVTSVGSAASLPGSTFTNKVTWASSTGAY